MAIPNRVTITCPNCGTSEDKTIADTSIGPRGRISKTPIYSMFTGSLWKQVRRDNETYLSCLTCNETDFTTLKILAKGG